MAQQLGRLAGQARGAAGEAERSAAAAARAQEALEKAVQEAEELAERLAVAEEMPVEEEPDTSVRDRLAADGANARQTEMEARLQVRTHEERVKASPGAPTRSTARPAPNARHARVPSSGGPGCGTRRRSPKPSPPAPGNCSRTSRCRSPGPSRSVPPPRPPRPGASRSWPPPVRRAVN